MSVYTSNCLPTISVDVLKADLSVVSVCTSLPCLSSGHSTSYVTMSVCFSSEKCLYMSSHSGCLPTMPARLRCLLSPTYLSARHIPLLSVMSGKKTLAFKLRLSVSLWLRAQSVCLMYTRFVVSTKCHVYLSTSLYINHFGSVRLASRFSYCLSLFHIRLDFLQTYGICWSNRS